jgi:DNA-binding NarL/FixJ family response regulator
MKVLIVDDSALVRVRLADLLAEIEGIEVVAQAEDASQASSLVRTLKPDVAILDVQMPKRSGLDLIEEVKRSPHAPKVIMLTNYPTPENREKSFSRGADYFFDKSGDIEEVINVLRNLERSSHGQNQPKH